MKRLFALRDNAGHLFQGIPRASGALSFDSKKKAKERRDELNAAKALGYPFTVTPGDDHHNYKA